jgi:hypothetical protein
MNGVSETSGEHGIGGEGEHREDGEGLHHSIVPFGVQL